MVEVVRQRVFHKNRRTGRYEDWTLRYERDGNGVVSRIWEVANGVEVEWDADIVRTSGSQKGTVKRSMVSKRADLLDIDTSDESLGWGEIVVSEKKIVRPPGLFIRLRLSRRWVEVEVSRGNR